MLDQLGGLSQDRAVGFGVQIVHVGDAHKLQVQRGGLVFQAVDFRVGRHAHDGDELAAQSHTGKRLTERVAADRVQDHGKSFALRGLKDDLCEVFLAVMNHPISPELVARCDRFLTSRSGPHRAAVVLGKLHGNVAHAACTRVNQHGLPRLDPCTIMQGFPRRQRDQRQGSGLGKIQRRRLERCGPGVQQHILRVTPLPANRRRSKNRIPLRKALHVLPHRYHRARHVIAKHDGEVRLAEPVLADLPVHRIARRRFDLHHKIMRPGDRVWNLKQLKVVATAQRMDTDGFHTASLVTCASAIAVTRTRFAHVRGVHCLLMDKDVPSTPPHFSAPPNPPAEKPSDVQSELDALLSNAGADLLAESGRRVRDVMQTSLKLLSDGADLGELKLISRSFKELRYALKVFRPYRQVRKISIFGSARTPIDHPDYRSAVDFAQAMVDAQWMVITGAGDGIMRAGHHGAKREASFGVSIRLPFETNANDIIEGDEKLVMFRYFFTRKLMFMWQSHAIALFPGGFGTQDEAFEALTLIQTGKAPLIPLVMVEPTPEQGGGSYWKHWDNYVRRSLGDHGWISPEDTSLYRLFNDPAEAALHVRHFYRNYHSQRFVDDRMVIRMQRQLKPDQLRELNDQFGKLIVSGHIEQSGPLEAERQWTDLPRLHWHSTRRGYGTLRQLIDRVNDFDLENHGDIPEPSGTTPQAQTPVSEPTDASSPALND